MSMLRILNTVEYVRKSPVLSRIISPLANWFQNATGHRELGLFADDLIDEDLPAAKKALQRLSPRELSDRVYRHKRAFHLSMCHQILPKEEWTKVEDDVPYLRYHMQNVEKELAEKNYYQNLITK